MEVIMPSIIQLIIGTVVAIAMAVLGWGGGAVAGSVVPSHEVLTNRDEPPSSETDSRISERQQLRRLFFDAARRGY
jgi:hypothetical protein